jgi:hypothetical protein
VFNKLLAIDPGFAAHPTGWLLLEVRAPTIAVRDGRLVEPATGEDANPDGLPASEAAQPAFAVLDAQSRKGLDPKALVREALATGRDHGGGLAVVVDCGGIGFGLWQDLRETGLNTYGVQFTSGAKVGGGRRKLTVPVSRMYSDLYRALSQGRVLAPPPLDGRLKQELASVSVGVTDAGRETYEVNTSEHHADLVSCLGMAVVVAEVRGRFSQRIIAAARQDERRERPRTGRRRASNAARAVIEQRKEESRQAAVQQAGDFWSPLGVFPARRGWF